MRKTLLILFTLTLPLLAFGQRGMNPGAASSTTAELDEITLMTEFWDCFDFLTSMDANDSTLIVGTGDSGFMLLSIGDDPSELTLLSAVHDVGHVVAVALFENYAFIARQESMGIAMYDITDPTAPVFLNELGLDGHAYDICVQNGSFYDYVFIASGLDGIYSVEFSDAGALELVDTYPVGNGVLVNDIDLWQHKLVCSGYDAGGLFILDTSNPDDLSLMEQVNGGGSDAAHASARWMHYTNGEPYVLSALEDRVNLYHFQNETLSFAASLHTMNEEPIDARANAAGSHVFMSTQEDSLFIYDITDLSWVWRSGREHIRYQREMYMPDDEMLYVLGGLSGVEMVNVADPEAPFIQSVHSFPSWVESINVTGDGNYGVVTHEWGPATILDLTDMANPTVIGPLGDYVNRDVILDGSIAYSLSYWIHTVDISDPANPQELGGWNAYSDWNVNPSSPGYSQIFGNILITSSSGLNFIDISDPTDLQFLGTFDDITPYGTCSLDGDILYVAKNTGWYTYDVTNPSNPAILGFLDAQGADSYSSMVKAGDLIYSLTTRYGASDVNLVTIDGSDPENMQLLGSAPVPDLESGTYMKIQVEDNYVVLSGSSTYGIYIYDVSDPANPVLDGRLEDTGTKKAATVGSTIIAPKGWTLAFYDASDHLSVEEARTAVQPDEFELSHAYPNPFNATTRVSVNLPRQAELTVSVVDITGRLVATLTDGVRSAGVHTVAFNGHDLSSGVYLLQASTGDWTATRKLVLIK